MIRKSKTQKLRYFVQFMFFGFISLIIALHSLNEQGLVSIGGANVHALCPLGGFETIYSYLTKGEYISKIHASSLILSGIIIMLALFVGKFFCGWICAFGTLNDYFFKLGQKVMGKRFVLPQNIDRLLKLLKYLVLLIIIVFTWSLGELVFADYDPWTAFAHIANSPESFSETPWAFSILAAVLIGGLFIERFFCRYLCPLGAIQAIFAKVGFTRLVRDDSACIDCGACNSHCPVGIELSTSNTIDAAECINCLECVTDGCPQGISAIKLSGFYNKKGTQVVYLVVAFMIFYGVYGTTKLTGYWETTVNVQKVSAEAKNVDGTIDPSAIKGSFEIKDVIEIYGIEQQDLYARLNLPEDFSKHKKCKDIIAFLQDNGYPEASMDWVRDAVQDSNFSLDSIAGN